MDLRGGRGTQMCLVGILSGGCHERPPDTVLLGDPRGEGGSGGSAGRCGHLRRGLAAVRRSPRHRAHVVRSLVAVAAIALIVSPASAKAYNPTKADRTIAK